MLRIVAEAAQIQGTRAAAAVTDCRRARREYDLSFDPNQAGRTNPILKSPGDLGDVSHQILQSDNGLLNCSPCTNLKTATTCRARVRPSLTG